MTMVKCIDTCSCRCVHVYIDRDHGTYPRFALITVLALLKLTIRDNRRRCRVALVVANEFAAVRCHSFELARHRLFYDGPIHQYRCTQALRIQRDNVLGTLGLDAITCREVPISDRLTRLVQCHVRAADGTVALRHPRMQLRGGFETLATEGVAARPHIGVRIQEGIEYRQQAILIRHGGLLVGPVRRIPLLLALLLDDVVDDDSGVVAGMERVVLRRPT